jgi:L-lactate dehydrogenase complex protein LldF
MHIVLLDNGRTDALADPVGRDALRCIRCSACLNVCPVYQRAGGHAYGSVYPGPIGAVLTPQLRGITTDVDRSLPYASSLCGACFDACPVRIDIPALLVHLRTRVVDDKRGGRPSAESVAMKAASWVFGDHRRLAAAGKGAALAGKSLRSRLFGAKTVLRWLPWPASIWSGARDVPVPPTETFRDWWDRTDGGRESS